MLEAHALQAEMPDDFTSPPSNTMKLKLPQGVLNTPHADIIANIRANIELPLPQVRPYGVQAEHLCIVGGGWSLWDTLEELRALHHEGVPIMALNGAGHWLMEQGIRASSLVVIDARSCNLPFVETAIPRCRYLLASQCSPSLFDACEGRDLTIFHVISTESEIEREILDKHYSGRWHEIIGASTVGLRSMAVARMLGFNIFHMFGLDSCFRGDEHHAYPQEWQNDTAYKVWCAGRSFTCASWQMSQAEQFQAWVKKAGDHFNLRMYGDGLLAHMVRTGVDLQDKEEIPQGRAVR